MKSNDWRHKNVARYTPGNTKILYFFNCLLDGMHTIFLLTLLLVLFWQSDHRFLHSRGAVLWLGQNQNIMLDNFEIFQKVMAFQKMNTSKQAFSKFLSRIAQKKLKKNGFTIRLNFIPLCCGVLTVTSRDRF